MRWWLLPLIARLFHETRFDARTKRPSRIHRLRSGFERASMLLPSRTVLVGALFGLGLIPWCFWGGIAGSSEARELHVVRAMVEEGLWLNPDRNGLPPSKPPLFHWISGGLVWLLQTPVEVGWLRLVSLLHAFGIVLLTASLLRRFIPRDAIAPVLGGVVLFSCYGWVSMAFTAMVDMTLAFWTMVGVWALGFDREIPRSKWWFGALGAALAVLAKGPLGLVLVGVGVVATRLALGLPLRPLIVPRLAWILAIVLGSSWYLYLYLSVPDGALVLARQLGFENVERLVGSEQMNTESWWFYGPSLLRTSAPWGLLAFVLLFIRGWRSAPPIVRAGFSWLILGVAFFSLAAGKRHSYLLPLYPALVLMVVPLVVLAWHDGSHRVVGFFRRLGEGAGAAVPLLVVCFLLGWELLGDLTHLRSSMPEIHVVRAVLRESLPPLLLSCFIILVVWKMSERWLGVGVALVLLGVAIGSTTRGVKAELRPFVRVADMVRREHQGGASISYLRERNDEYLDPVAAQGPLSASVILPGADPTTTLVVLRGGARLPDGYRSVATFAPIGERRVERHIVVAQREEAP